MSLKQELRDELQRLHGAVLPVGIRCDAPPDALTCGLLALDPIGCAFSSLEVYSPRLAGDSLSQLKKRAAKLTAAVNYLLEPLGLVEVDGEAAVVQLRSKPPQRDGRERTYYELLVRREGILLTRWRWAPGQARTAIPAEVTREVLLRLAGDMQDAAQ